MQMNIIIHKNKAFITTHYKRKAIVEKAVLLTSDV